MESYKEKALAWANSFDVCCFLDSNGFTDPYGKFEWIVAAGVNENIVFDGSDAFDALKKFYAEQQ
ncbi:MAG: aminodeoxychorismate synthase component I, partial [Sphingobacteriales bacterium]